MKKILIATFWFLPITLYYLEHKKDKNKELGSAHSQTEKDIDRLLSLACAVAGVIFILTLIF